MSTEKVENCTVCRKPSQVFNGAGYCGSCVASLEAPAPTMHQSCRELLRFFEYGHLPERLQAVSAPFHGLAHTIAVGPQNAETTTALRKLLESKDCAVRARL